MSRIEPKKTETLEIRVSHETKQQLNDLASRQNSSVSELVRSQIDALLKPKSVGDHTKRRAPWLRAGIVGIALAGLFSMSLFQSASAENIFLSIEGQYLRSQMGSDWTQSCDTPPCNPDWFLLDPIDPENYDPTTTWKSTLRTEVQIEETEVKLELPIKTGEIKIYLYAKLDERDILGKSVLTRVQIVELYNDEERVLSEPELLTTLGTTSNFKSTAPGRFLNLDLTAHSSDDSDIVK